MSIWKSFPLVAPINLTHHSLHCPKLPSCQLPRSCNGSKSLKIFHFRRFPQIFSFYDLWYFISEKWRSLGRTMKMCASGSAPRCLVLSPLGPIWQPLLEINLKAQIKSRKIKKKNQTKSQQKTLGPIWQPLLEINLKAQNNPAPKN